MRTAQVDELKDRLDEVIAAVKNGEMVEIRDGEVAIAELVPSLINQQIHHGGKRRSPGKHTALEAHLDELVREGKARRATDTLPADFFTRPLPQAKRSVLEALLEDRHSD